MRPRRASPLLFLLLAPSFVASQAPNQPVEATEALTNDEILALNRAPKDQLAPNKVDADAASTSLSGAKSTNTKPYVGTEAAPVDGLDGKPHAGPFVDRKPEPRKGDAATATSKSVPTSLDNFKAAELADIPEKNDGVMNDENRPAPKQGTTGTEGGISEKDKVRKEKEVQTENTPQEPKAAPPLPHSEEERVDSENGNSPKSPDKKQPSSTTEGGKDAVTGETVDAKKDGDYGEAGYGMEKPTNLPEKPHNLPIPEPRVATSPGDDNYGPPVNQEDGRNKWLVDTMPDTEGQTNKKGPKKTKTETPATLLGDESDESSHEWFHSFVLSFTMIIFSEIGDKTFLVAALMAMRHARLLVFSAALAALIAMTVLSAVLGHAFPTLLPKKFTTFAAAMLFFVFGAKSLREGLAMPQDAGIGEEMREVEAELEEKEHTMRGRSKGELPSPYDIESGRGRSQGVDRHGRPEPSPPLSRSPSPPRGRRGGLAGLTNLCSLVLSPAWVQTFIMTFLGEWGDRSQIATIAMAAGQDYWLVTLGAIVGHACCTGLAVLGGRALAGKVSMRLVTIGGAVAFLVFGCIYLYECLVD